MASQAPDWLTVPEACAYLKISRGTIYRWAKLGHLKLYKLGGRTTRVQRSELDGMARLWQEEEASFAALSLDVFARDWDNDKDAIYDNWRELYGVPEG